MADRIRRPEIIEWLKVDPDIARALIEASAESDMVNRPINRTNLRYLVADMIADKYISTSTPIKFNRRAGIIDGQHRLRAVIESGRAQVFLVIRNCADEELKVEGSGFRWSQGDAKYVEERGRLSKQQYMVRVALANAMLRGIRRKVEASPRSKDEFYERHIETIEWVLELAGAAATRTKSTGIRLPTGCLAAVARASYSVDRDRLERFVSLLLSPTVGPGEAVVLQLRDYILQNPVGSGGSGSLRALVIYRLTEAAIQAYAKRQEPRRLKATDVELYPLPAEDRRLDNAAD